MVLGGPRRVSDRSGRTASRRGTGGGVSRDGCQRWRPGQATTDSGPARTACDQPVRSLCRSGTGAAGRCVGRDGFIAGTRPGDVLKPIRCVPRRRWMSWTRSWLTLRCAETPRRRGVRPSQSGSRCGVASRRERAAAEPRNDCPSLWCARPRRSSRAARRLGRSWPRRPSVVRFHSDRASDWRSACPPYRLPPRLSDPPVTLDPTLGTRQAAAPHPQASSPAPWACGPTAPRCDGMHGDR